MTLSSTAAETAIAQCTRRWAMARGHRLNTSIVLAAVHGLSGLFRAVDDDVGLHVLGCRVDILGTMGRNRFHVALRPRRRNGLEWEGDDRMKARPRKPSEKDRRDRGPPPEQWKC